jgi:hypothetical protein
VAWRGVAWRGVAWRGVAWRGVAWRGVAWRGVARRGVARRGAAWRGVAWRGVARRGVACAIMLRPFLPPPPPTAALRRPLSGCRLLQAVAAGGAMRASIIDFFVCLAVCHTVIPIRRSKAGGGGGGAGVAAAAPATAGAVTAAVGSRKGSGNRVAPLPAGQAFSLQSMSSVSDVQDLVEGAGEDVGSRAASPVRPAPVKTAPAPARPGSGGGKAAAGAASAAVVPVTDDGARCGPGVHEVDDLEYQVRGPHSAPSFPPPSPSFPLPSLPPPSR